MQCRHAPIVDRIRVSPVLQQHPGGLRWGIRGRRGGTLAGRGRAGDARCVVQGGFARTVLRVGVRAAGEEQLCRCVAWKSGK